MEETLHQLPYDTVRLYNDSDRSWTEWAILVLVPIGGKKYVALAQIVDDEIDHDESNLLIVELQEETSRSYSFGPPVDHVFVRSQVLIAARRLALNPELGEA